MNCAMASVMKPTSTANTTRPKRISKTKTNRKPLWVGMSSTPAAMMSWRAENTLSPMLFCPKISSGASLLSVYHSTPTAESTAEVMIVSRSRGNQPFAAMRFSRP